MKKMSNLENTGKITYEVDEAMLGSEWKDEWELSDFVNILQELYPEIEIKGIYDSFNGANNDSIAQESVSEIVWMEALEKFAEKYD